MKRAIVIIGPTASGKTELALMLAEKFKGELVACDSRQVYRGLDIGTGKVPGIPPVIASPKGAKQSQKLAPEIASSQAPRNDIKKSKGWWQINGIKVWLYDLLDPDEQINAFDWAKKAAEVIREIESRGKVPIIVGGSGLYLRALLDGFDRLPKANLKLHQELAQMEIKELQSRVSTLSPARWAKLNHSDRNNPRRLSRIIEQVFMYGYIDKTLKSNDKPQISNVLKIGLTAPRPYLNSQINQRVLVWFNQGILEEVKKLIDRGVPAAGFKQFGLEYALIARYLKGEIQSPELLIRLIQTKIRQYAKRQLTWFKKEKNVTWFDISEPGLSLKVEELVKSWYNESEKRLAESGKKKSNFPLTACL